ncbi:hypothetical protein HYH02_013549 [Chlamydomonas schloesseri]|uniref:FAD-binding FR-type domain-containing protein n=1 Tax=Chlamydomonas schloesseri TaxID=2026947 RepID=A0A835VX11_9CHLO|nr:hypothetical protein HYH02_013549 [Chlamydomonas schloesseri]|eukprot:KAG2431020.1 hypothetical protein HYH02_013549 [Chlamydomonas schloesseri]
MTAGGQILVFRVWILLNIAWLLAGLHKRDFNKIPKWILEAAAEWPPGTPLGRPSALRLLAVLDGVGMAACWPLLANLVPLLLPVDRGLLLLSCVGSGHEGGTRAHAYLGASVFLWTSTHAVLCQVPMAAVSRWRALMLPGAHDGKAAANGAGLLGWLALLVLTASSLAPVRRRAFNAFILLHKLMAPAFLLLGCLHDGHVSAACACGMSLHAADLVQRWLLRRRTATAAASLRGSSLLLLHVPTPGPPGCLPGQHVWLQVPSASCWEWHPYSVADYDAHGFSLLIKGRGDWERRLLRAAASSRGEALMAAERHDSSTADGRMTVRYEGMYGTPDLRAAVLAADRLLLFAGGSGVSVMASVLRVLLQERKASSGGGGGGGPCALALVWSVAEEADMQPLAQLLRAAAARKGWSVHVYVTRQQQQQKQQQLLTSAPAGALLALPAPAGACHLQQYKAACCHDEARPPSRPQPPGPWQLHTAGSALVVAAAAAAAAGCSYYLGQWLSSRKDCEVAVPTGVTEAAADWVAAVTAAYKAQARTAPAGSCPALDAAAALLGQWDEDDGGWGGGDGGGGGRVKLRWCRLAGGVVSELCAKCDPLKPRPQAEAPWPCCSLAVCFLGARLPPLLAWLAGALAGAALASAAWRLYCWRRPRQWRQQQQQALARDDRVDEGRLRWWAAAVKVQTFYQWLSGVWGDKGTAGGYMDSELCRLLGPAAVEEAPLACGAGGGAGLVVFRGRRPDVGAYMRWAAGGGPLPLPLTAGATHAAVGGCDEEPPSAAAVCGVLVCGPESLQQDVTAQYQQQRQLLGTRSECWLHSFSFTS